MTTALWMEITPSWVQVNKLIATQPGLYIGALILPSDSYSKDPVPHVVQWNGELYLEDGHHRIIKELLKGRNTARVRILRLPLDS